MQFKQMLTLFLLAEILCVFRCVLTKKNNNSSTKMYIRTINGIRYRLSRLELINNQKKEEKVKWLFAWLFLTLVKFKNKDFLCVFPRFVLLNIYCTYMCIFMYQTIDFDAFLNDTFDSLLGCSMIVSFSPFLFLRFCFARNFDTVVSVRNFNNNNNNKKRERIEMIYFFHKYIYRRY